MPTLSPNAAHSIFHRQTAQTALQLRLCAEDQMNRSKEALLILGAFVAMAFSSSTKQWIRDGYVRGDMQWRQDSYGCSLDASEMTSGGVYGNSLAPRTWDECM